MIPGITSKLREYLSERLQVGEGSPNYELKIYGDGTQWINSPVEVPPVFNYTVASKFNEPRTMNHSDLTNDQITLAARDDGKIHVMSVNPSTGEVMEGYAPTATSIVYNKDCVTDWVGTGVYAPHYGKICLSKIDGQLFLSVYSDTTQTEAGFYKLYVSPSGIGGDWEFYSTVYERLMPLTHKVYNSSYTSYTIEVYPEDSWYAQNYNWSSAKYTASAGEIVVLQSGRWVLMGPNLTSWGWGGETQAVGANIAVWTSDDKGKTWIYRRSFYAYMVLGDYYETSYPVKVWQSPSTGALFYAYGLNQGGYWIRIYKSTDEGVNWTCVMEEATWSISSLWGDPAAHGPNYPYGAIHYDSTGHWFGFPDGWAAPGDLIDNGSGGFFMPITDGPAHYTQSLQLLEFTNPDELDVTKWVVYNRGGLTQSMAPGVQIPDVGNPGNPHVQATYADGYLLVTDGHWVYGVGVKRAKLFWQNNKPHLLPVKSISFDRRLDAPASEVEFIVENKDGRYSPDFDPSKYPGMDLDGDFGYNKILYPENRVELFLGYGEELVQQFTGTIDKVTINSENGEISVSCRDHMKYLIDQVVIPEDTTVLQYPPEGDTKPWLASAIIGDLILRANATAEVEESIFDGKEYTVNDYGVELGTKYLDAIQKLTDSIGYRTYCDRFGIIRSLRKVYPEENVVPDVSYFDYVDLTSAEYTLNFEDVRDTLIISSENGWEEFYNEEFRALCRNFPRAAKIDVPWADTSDKRKMAAENAFAIMKRRGRVLRIGTRGNPNVQLEDVAYVKDLVTAADHRYVITGVNSTFDDTGYTDVIDLDFLQSATSVEALNTGRFYGMQTTIWHGQNFWINCKETRTATLDMLGEFTEAIVKVGFGEDLERNLSGTTITMKYAPTGVLTVESNLDFDEILANAKNGNLADLQARGIQTYADGVALNDIVKGLGGKIYYISPGDGSASSHIALIKARVLSKNYKHDTIELTFANLTGYLSSIPCAAKAVNYDVKAISFYSESIASQMPAGDPVTTDPGTGGGAGSPVTYTPTETKSWRTWTNAWRNDNDRVYEGGWYENGVWHGNHKGLICFGADQTANMRSTLAGKTIDSVKLYVRRLNAGGYASSQAVRFYSHNYDSIPGGEPSLGTNWGELCSLNRGESTVVNLPVAFGAELANGTARGIATHEPGGSPYVILLGKTEYNIKLEIAYH